MPFDASSRVIDLDENGAETAVVYKIQGKEFRCFPVDELAAIHAAIDEKEKETGENTARAGDVFLEIIQDRLREKHKISASLDKCGRWYDSLHVELESQTNFTNGSLGGTDSTASDPAPVRTPAKKSGSSKSPRSRSKPKSQSANSGT